MANEISIYWGREHLAILQGEYAGNIPRAEQIIVEQWPVDPFDGDLASIASFVKEIKAKYQLTGSSVSVVLPREQVIVRQLELPKVDEYERFDIVRFQIATKLTIPVEHLTTDFYILPPATENLTDSPDKVFVAAVRNNLIERLRSVLSLSGWELKNLYPAYISLAEFSAKSKGSAQEQSLVIWKHGQTMEWVALRAGKIITTQQVKKYDATPEQRARAVVMDFKRAMVNFPELEETQSLDILTINQEEDSPFIQALEQEFKLPVGIHEYPMSGIELPAEALPLAIPLLGALGQLHNRQIETLNLASPRQPKPRVDNTRAKRLAMVGGGVLVFAFGFFTWNMIMEGYQDEITKLKADKGNLNNLLTRSAPILESEKAITAWQKLDEDPLKQIVAINQLSPGSQAVYMTSMKFLTDEAKGVVHVTGDGLAKEREDVDIYYEQLVSAGFRIRPKAIEQLSGSREYPYKFSLDADLPDTNIKNSKSSSKTNNKVTTPANNTARKGTQS